MAGVTTMTADLPSLIAAVEALTGPSREVDAQLHCLIHGASFKGVFYLADDGGVLLMRNHEAISMAFVGNYTGSLDAAFDLFRKLLPDFLLAIEEQGPGRAAYAWVASVYPRDDADDRPTSEGAQDLLACAIVLATLKARAARAG